MALRREILAWCDETLQVGLFKDYAPNGLQVEAKKKLPKSPLRLPPVKQQSILP